ncbi:unnamed protein product [Ectocarpus sp. CCAP 1310/34]|nr:unnamed protein product [Ectocarpus sp. CCAP 1310/34]
MLGLACPGNGLSLRMIVTIDGSHHPGADGCWNRVAHSSHHPGADGCWNRVAHSR